MICTRQTLAVRVPTDVNDLAVRIASPLCDRVETIQRQFLANVEFNKVKEVERLKEVEAAVNVQTMEFLEKKRNQLQDEVDAWEERQATTAAERSRNFP